MHNKLEKDNVARVVEGSHLRKLRIVRDDQSKDVGGSTGGAAAKPSKTKVRATMLHHILRQPCCFTCHCMS